VAQHGITSNAVAPGWIRTDSSPPDELIWRSKAADRMSPTSPALAAWYATSSAHATSGPVTDDTMTI
jgi:NAD(P)-dependent dehydrogenase (short-subunit alcohol dehydrogenase family)